MSMAWETHEIDVEIVLTQHGIKVSKNKLIELFDGLDHDDIEDTVLTYQSMDDQTSAMLHVIEEHLIEEGIVSERKFPMPDSGELPEDDDCENYTISVRVHCSLEQAKELTDMVSDFADNAIEYVDADVVLCDIEGNEVK